MVSQPQVTFAGVANTTAGNLGWGVTPVLPVGQSVVTGASSTPYWSAQMPVMATMASGQGQITLGATNAPGVSGLVLQQSSVQTALPAYRDVRLDPAFMAAHAAHAPNAAPPAPAAQQMTLSPMMAQHQTANQSDGGRTNYDQRPRLQETRVNKYEFSDNIFDFIRDFEIVATCNDWNYRHRQSKLYEALSGKGVRDAIRNIPILTCSYHEYVDKVIAELKPSYDNRHYRAIFYQRSRDLKGETPVEFWRILSNLHREGWPEATEADRMSAVVDQFKLGHPANVRSAMVYACDKETLIAIGNTADPGRNIRGDNHDSRPPRASQIEVDTHSHSSEAITSSDDASLTPSSLCEVNKISYDNVRKKGKSNQTPIAQANADPALASMQKMLEKMMAGIDSNRKSLLQLQKDALPIMATVTWETLEDDEIHGQCGRHLVAIIASVKLWKRGSDNFGKLPDRKRFKRSGEDREHAKGNTPGIFRGACYFCKEEGHSYGRCTALREFLRKEYDKLLNVKDGPKVDPHVYAVSIQLEACWSWVTDGFSVADANFPSDERLAEN